MVAGHIVSTVAGREIQAGDPLTFKSFSDPTSLDGVAHIEGGLSR